MKTTILATILGLFMTGVAAFAGNDVPLNPIDDDTPIMPGHGKSPVEVPSLWQDGYELTFLSSHDDYTLELRQGGVVVCSTFVSSTTNTVILPSTLQGEYEIRLYGDESYYLTGYISLGQ